MRFRGVLFGLLLLVGALLGAAGWLAWQRVELCRPIPGFAPQLLPNAALSSEGAATLPTGWKALAPGVQLVGPAVGNRQGFDLDGDGRSLQLLGIGNAVTTPALPVASGATYCFTGRALTDSEKGSATRLQLTFRWLDQTQQVIAEDLSAWQAVALWNIDLPPAEWALISHRGTAPSQAAFLEVAIRAASDDRVYLDTMHLQSTWHMPQPDPAKTPVVRIHPWPAGAQAALSFSFDWETAMGGLVHSRSVDDLYADQDPSIRALRMREGVTTTLAIFAPYAIRATYYANGYNFLDGNTERREFMGNPVFRWANAQNRWKSDAWTTTPWFAPDPYGTIQSHPAWYFGDLTRRLVAAGHDIQSHTFAHMYVGLATNQELQVDAASWNQIAAEQGVPAARSLAFPWSGNAGLSDRGWEILAEAGIRSVTRTTWGSRQRQFQLVTPEEPHCRPVPGHEQILVCPDFPLTVARAAQAKALIDQVISKGGMIDLWTHTEEVTQPDQIAAWQDVVGYAARQRDAGALWIAPLAEIADRQQLVNQLQVHESPGPDRSTVVRISNPTELDVNDLTLVWPFTLARATVNGQAVQLSDRRAQQLILSLAAGASLEVTVWPE